MIAALAVAFALPLATATPESAGPCERLINFKFEDSAAVWLGHEFDGAKIERGPDWTARVREAADALFPLRYVILTADLDTEPDVEGAIGRAHFDAPTSTDIAAWSAILARETSEWIRQDLLVAQHGDVGRRVVRARQAYLSYLNLFAPGAVPAGDREWLRRNHEGLLGSGPAVNGHQRWLKITTYASVQVTRANERLRPGAEDFANLYEWLIATAVQFPHLLDSEDVATRVLDFDTAMANIGYD